MEYQVRLLAEVVAVFGIMVLTLPVGQIIYARHEQSGKFTAVFDGIYSIDDLPITSFEIVK